MPKVKIKTHILKATITEEQNNMINNLLASGKYISEADIVRQALLAFYAKVKPAYLEPSINQEVKLEKRAKELELRDMPDEEFVAENLEDVMIYTDLDGIKWVLHRWIGNTIGAVPLLEVKNWVKEKGTLFVVHTQIANTGKPSYEEELRDNSTRKWLNERFGVAINFDPKYNGGIYDEEFGGVRPNES